MPDLVAFERIVMVAVTPFYQQRGSFEAAAAMSSVTNQSVAVGDGIRSGLPNQSRYTMGGCQNPVLLNEWYAYLVGCHCQD